jgi:DNA polymerase-3 subunit beta
MKFIVSSTFLLKNLQAVSGVLISNSSLPILNDFLFDLSGDNLKITTSDIETTMTISLQVSMAAESGIVAVPAKILIETLKTLPDVPVTFTVDPITLGIEIVAGEGKYKMNGHNGEDFPETPVIDEGNEFFSTFDSCSSAKASTHFCYSACSNIFGREDRPELFVMGNVGNCWRLFFNIWLFSARSCG